MDDETQKMIAEQFDALPQVVKDAITSGHIEEKFQQLAPKYKLHFDVWQQVQNKIMLTVLGLLPAEQLVAEIARDAKISTEQATEIVDDVAATVFQPIREELERGLGHPQAVEENLTDVEKLRQATLSQEAAENKLAEKPPHTAPAPIPGTPPPAPPTEKATRMPASGAYKPGEISSTRKDVHDDPYREPPL